MLLLFSDLVDFFSSVPKYGALLGIDLGEKKIGIAVSDVNRSLATPRCTIMRKNFSYVIKELLGIVCEYDVCGLVVGLPLNMDGSFGRKAQGCRDFSKMLASSVNLPVLLWDERLSTFDSRCSLAECYLSGRKRDAYVDRVAASIFLQSALDSFRRSKK